MHDIPEQTAAPPSAQRLALRPYARQAGKRWRQFRTGSLITALGVICVLWGFFFALTAPFFLMPFFAPLGILALFAIWALPDTDRAPTGLLTFLFMGFFTSTILWPNYLALTFPGLPWITTIRLFGLPLAILLLVCTSISKDFRTQISQALQATPILWKFVTAFAVVQTLTIAFSKSPTISINSTISDHTSWTVVFFASIYIFLQRGVVQRWATLFWSAALILCLFGLWEQALGHVPWSGHIPAFLGVQDEYVQRVLQGARRLGTGAYRVQTIQSTSLGLSEFLALTTPFAIHFMAGKYPIALRIVAGLSLPLIFFVIILTDARLGVVGFFLSFLLYVLVWSARRWRYAKESILGPAFTVAYPVIFVAFLAFSILWQRLRVVMWGGGEASGSSQARIDQYSHGIPMVLSRPWGYGPAMGAEKLGFVSDSGVLTIDTYYLLVALDYGIIGFILYYGALSASIYYAAKYAYNYRLSNREHQLIIPAGISLSSFLVIKSIFSQTQNHALQFMMMAMVAALVYRIKRDET